MLNRRFSYNLNSTNISSGALYTTNATTNNIVATAISTGSLNVSNTITSTNTTGSLLATNVTTTNVVTTAISAASLNVSNAIANTATTGSLLATTSISSGALFSTNVTATNIVATAISAASLNVSNAITSALTTGSLLATTSISSGALFSTNVTATNIVTTAISSASLNVTNTISTNSIIAISNTNTLGSLFTTTGGNVGIGTTSPSEALTVIGNIRLGPRTDLDTDYSIKSTAQLTISANDAATQNAAYTSLLLTSGVSSNQSAINIAGSSTNKYVSFNTSNTERMRIDSAGNVGIGGVLSGGSAYGEVGTVVPCVDGSLGRMVRGGGYIEFTSNVGGIGVSYFLSDIRKKINIIPCTLMCSDMIDNMEFINFDWGPDSGMTGNEKVGFSAQQLQKIDEKLVNELFDGGLMINEPALLVRLAKSLQEQIRINKQQQKTIENLKQFLQSKFPGEI